MANRTDGPRDDTSAAVPGATARPAAPRGRVIDCSAPDERPGPSTRRKPRPRGGADAASGADADRDATRPPPR